MKRRYVIAALVSLASFGKTVFAQEIKAERKAQNSLPRSRDPLWPKLRACKVILNEKSGLYSLMPTPDIKQLQGQTVRIKGFVLPLDGEDRTQHFLIGINTPVCLYHPPGEPNEVIEVQSLKPVQWSENQVTIEGIFGLINKREMGVFFSLTKARQV